MRCRPIGMRLGMIALWLSLSSVAQAASINLAWENPTTHVDGSPLTDLHQLYVHYGTSTGVYTTTIPAGLVNTYQVDGLTAGVTYYFAVTAEDTSGQVSGYSNEASGTPSSTAQELVLSPTGDTFININTRTHDKLTFLGVYTWPANTVANAILMKFSLSSLPANALVESAVLHLVLTESDEIPVPYLVTAHRLTANPTLSQATGKRRTSSANWTANACCYNNFPMAQANIAAASSTTPVETTVGDKAFDVTPIIHYWRAHPTQNYGILLNADTSQPADRYRFFASLEHPTVSSRPSLVITYTVP